MPELCSFYLNYNRTSVSEATKSIISKVQNQLYDSKNKGSLINPVKPNNWQIRLARCPFQGKFHRICQRTKIKRVVQSQSSKQPFLCLFSEPATRSPATWTTSSHHPLLPQTPHLPHLLLLRNQMIVRCHFLNAHQHRYWLVLAVVPDIYLD